MCGSRTLKYAKTRIKDVSINKKPRSKGKYDVDGGNYRCQGHTRTKL